MDKFSLKNQVEKVLRGENSNFLNPIDANYVINNVKKKTNYTVFKLFDETEKLIVYTKDLNITLFEIKTSSVLTHKEILGSLFSHNLSDDTFGDIVIYDNKYYIVVLNKVKEYLKTNYKTIGNKKIELIEKELTEVNDYKLKFREYKFNVSSLRIDNILSKLIPTSRNISKQYKMDKKINLNYSILKNTNYILKENDIFGIRGVGKFKLISINKSSKNDKYSVSINKYM